MNNLFKIKFLSLSLLFFNVLAAPILQKSDEVKAPRKLVSPNLVKDQAAEEFFEKKDAEKYTGQKAKIAIHCFDAISTILVMNLALKIYKDQLNGDLIHDSQFISGIITPVVLFNWISQIGFGYYDEVKRMKSGVAPKVKLKMSLLKQFGGDLLRIIPASIVNHVSLKTLGIILEPSAMISLYNGLKSDRENIAVSVGRLLAPTIDKVNVDDSDEEDEEEEEEEVVEVKSKKAKK